MNVRAKLAIAQEQGLTLRQAITTGIMTRAEAEVICEDQMRIIRLSSNIDVAQSSRWGEVLCLAEALR